MIKWQNIGVHMTYQWIIIFGAMNGVSMDCCTYMNIIEYFNISLSLFKNVSKYSKYYCYNEIKKCILSLTKCLW